MSITALPSAPQTSDPPATFIAKADAFVAALAVLVTEMNAAIAVVNMTKWISGTTYAIGDVTWSPANFQTYRRKTAGAGTTDPSADTTNWALAIESVPSATNVDISGKAEDTAPDLFADFLLTLDTSAGGYKKVRAAKLRQTDIFPITASVASNALTLTLNPTIIDFRSNPITSGTVVSRSVSAAVSCVVPDTATLGTVSTKAARLAVLAIDNAGTVELAVVNLSGGNNLDESTLISTTALSAAADSANVIYSTTLRSNVAFRVVGYIDITEATAGTWATAPSTVQGSGGNAMRALQSIGYGQTWQNVGGSRAAGVSGADGTIYYNETGKPIMLSIWLQLANGSSYVDLKINNTLMARGTQTQGVANNWAFVTSIVPPGASYSCSTNSTSITSSNWFELR